jgi:hypothetical protein
VLALTCHIELFTQAHYRASIGADATLSDLWKDVFLYHWREESQHAVLDELEWQREDAKLTPAERDAAVDDLIALVGAVDGILQAQANADAGYFLASLEPPLSAYRMQQVRDTVLKAYRWQYIVSGVLEPRFQKLLASMVTNAQMHRIQDALAPLTYAVPNPTGAADGGLTHHPTTGRASARRTRHRRSIMKSITTLAVAPRSSLASRRPSTASSPACAG